MDDYFDFTNVSEDQFDQMVVYFVPDQPAENNSTLSRAEQSLPRILKIKPSQTKTSVSYFLKSSFFIIFKMLNFN